MQTISPLHPYAAANAGDKGLGNLSILNIVKLLHLARE